MSRNSTLLAILSAGTLLMVALFLAALALQMHLSGSTPTPFESRKPVTILASTGDPAPTAPVIAELIELVERSSGQCATANLALLCEPAACVMSYRSLSESEALAQLRQNPSLAIQRVLEFVGVDGWQDTPCATGRRLLESGAVNVEILTAKDPWQCILVRDPQVPLEHELTTERALRWCQDPQTLGQLPPPNEPSAAIPEDRPGAAPLFSPDRP